MQSRGGCSNTEVNTEDPLVEHRQVSYGGPVILGMGWERQGLSARMEALCDEIVRIPMVGRSDFLNLAVATGVMLYEVFHQKQAGLSYPW